MALTLPLSSNGELLFYTNSPNASSSHNNNNGQLNSHFKGGLTKTTPTLTPTRLKNIEEQFFEHSLLPPKPFLHDHMAGFVPPTVNIKLHLQQPHQQQQPIESDSILNDQDSQPLALLHQESSSKSIDYFSSNSISNDSFSSNNSISDDYSSETNSSCQAIANNAVGSKTRSSQKKSTGGGRKPHSSQNLSSDEILKRQKRRERNKLAAARCRKKRVDQTNCLIDQTKDLQKKHDALIKKVENRLKEFHSKKDVLLNHESQCHNIDMRIVQQIYAQIDFAAINSAMETVADEDLDTDLNTTCHTSSSQDEFSQQTLPPPKRKRPNSLVFRPMAHQQQNIKPEPGLAEQLQSIIGTNETNNTNTPSNGFSFADFAGLVEPTGLTPLNPSITTVDLTPSTMTAFLKSLASPIDDQKKLLSM
ncbi:bZIP Maf transcription factor [Dermatophagoides pteronyssinus]|uniref:BZIP Maf transcription factor n=1 Tax=Dermatophagoides pteronyssinus TaxID=6956 RepID=A0ABQ8JVP1_DERPT|nr:bZIP Maf transcription factor [Dermatophagoides pteronyssinus]